MTEHDPVIVALLKRLPEAGTFWPAELRRRWLDAMESTIDLVYLDAPPAPAIQREITEEQRKRWNGLSEVLSEASKPEPNAAREVTVGDEILLVATHIPEEQLQHTLAVKDMPSQTHQPDPPARKNVGGAPSQVGRPENIPTNREMAVEAIKELGPSSATQIRDFVKKKHWPGVPAHWTATLYEMVTSNKLARQGINFVLPPESKAVVAAPKKPKPAAAAPPALPRLYGTREQQEEFQHNGRGTMLSPKEYLLASRLRDAIGKGHIGVQFLAENALGLRRGQGEEAKLTLRQLASAMEERLATVGLAIEYHEGFGFLMKEVEVG